MAVATAPSSAVLLPRSSSSCFPSAGGRAVRRHQQGEGQKRQQRVRGVLATNILRIIRQDREFIATKLEPVAAPIRQVGSRVSKALDDFFWLRFLEKEGASTTRDQPPSRPNPSYPAALSGMDLLMADLEALKLYAGYLYYMSNCWSVPLPETYDLETVEEYFKCRPHILAMRVFEVLSSFASAAIRVQVSRSEFKSQRLNQDKNGDASQYYMGQLLKESMLKLGPTFIKVGQSLSTRPDIIGSGIARALSELYDKVPPFPRSVAMKIIEDELGCPVEDAFSYISEEPVAAASFGQVYQGRTHDGYVVAVKVQRPNLLHAVVRDIYILRIGLGILRKIAKRKSDPRFYADELGKGFVGELDYGLEAANATEFREVHAKYPCLSVPKVYKHLSGKRVLTMEWLVGENPTDLLSLSRRSATDSVGYMQQLDAKKRILDLVNKGVEASLVQLLETGILHADPHPGNLRYTPEGNIGFLDFGLLCRMQKKHQLAMLASIVHIVNGDWAALVQDLTEMDVVPLTTNIHHVTMDLEEALSEVAFKDGIPDIKFSKVLGKIWSIALKYHFRMPPYYTLVLRSLASLEGLAITSDQDFRAFQAAYPFVVQKLLYDNSTAARKILYSVVFNKKREFQWRKVTLFLKIGSPRLSHWSSSFTALFHASGLIFTLSRVVVLSTDADNHFLSFLSRNGHILLGTSPCNTHGRHSVFDVADLILKLLPSKDGLVLRRLLMDADAVSLARAMVSEKAIIFRQHISRALADIVYHWMTAMWTRQGIRSQYILDPVAKEQDASEGPSSPLLLVMLKDRRVKVIAYRVLSSIRGNPALTLQVCWTALTMFLLSSVLALHRLLVFSLDNLASLPLPFVPRLFAVGT